MQRVMIEISDVRKRFGRTGVLNGLSFSILPGQSVALWGSNGAGKTTLVRCLLGLIDFAGSIRVAGLDVRRHGKAARRLLGYVPQELALYDDLRTLEAARFMARLKGAPTSACEPLLAQLGLSDHLRKRVRELSGGLKQRLALAVALLNDPPILILDEPTSNLDTAARAALLDLLLSLKRAGKTILFISHRPEEVAGLADRVLTLENGLLLTDTAPSPPSQAQGLQSLGSFPSPGTPGEGRGEGSAHRPIDFATALPSARDAGVPPARLFHPSSFSLHPSSPELT